MTNNKETYIVELLPLDTQMSDCPKCTNKKSFQKEPLYYSQYINEKKKFLLNMVVEQCPVVLQGENKSHYI